MYESQTATAVFYVVSVMYFFMEVFFYKALFDNDSNTAVDLNNSESNEIIYSFTTPS
ncbi:MAG: hypothetical protein E7C49_02045 [Clostridium sp.]|nr:hypothetical protein [Clostridium sp.]